MIEESASAISSSIWASMNSWFTPTVLFVLLNLMIATIAFTSTPANQKQNLKNSPDDRQRPNIAKSPSSLLHRLKSINLHTHFRSQEHHLSSTHYKPNPDSDTLCSVGNLDTRSHYFFQDTNPQENLETQTLYVFEQTHENNLQETRARLDFEEKECKYGVSEQALEEKVVGENSSEQGMDEVYGQLTGSQSSRTKSETELDSGGFPTKLPARMRKSASLKSAFGRFEEEAIVETRRPATVRENGNAKVTEGDEEVDAEAIVETRRPATVRENGNAKVTEGDEEVDAKADDFINRFKQQLKLQRLDSIIRYKDMIGRGSVAK